MPEWANSLRHGCYAEASPALRVTKLWDLASFVPSAVFSFCSECNDRRDVNLSDQRVMLSIELKRFAASNKCKQCLLFTVRDSATYDNLDSNWAVAGWVKDVWAMNCLWRLSHTLYQIYLKTFKCVVVVFKKRSL